MNRIFLTLIMMGAASHVAAQDWALRDSDTPLSRAEVVDLTSGHTLVFFDDGQSKFSIGGSYSYSYANHGGTAFGRFTVGDDGQVCIDYRNGFSRCDRYVFSGERMVLLTQKGERYPIRERRHN